MDYSVVLFDLKTEGAPSEKPLMLQPVLFCPVLTWVCQELRACGAQRFFAVCDADAREEVLAAAEGFDLTCVDSAEEALAQVQGGVIAVPGAVVPAAGEPSRAVYAADAGELRARLGEGRTLADCPAEASGILQTQYERGSNGYVKSKYVTLTIEAESVQAARARFSRIEADTLNRFKVMGAAAKVLDGKERLAYSKNLGPIIPLVSKNADYEHNYAYKSNEESPISMNLYFNGHDQAGIVGFPSGTMGFKNNGATAIKISISSSDADKFYVKFNWPSYGKEKDGTATMSIYGVRYTGERDVLYKETSPYNTKNGKVWFSALVLNINGASQYTGFNVNFESTDVLPDEYLVGDVLVFGDFDNFEISYPNAFYVAPNLPDISQGDFILALMSMNGLFAYADKNSPNTIKLISIDDIIANVQKNDIIDWSDRVILNDLHRVDMPDASMFTIDDLAQSNILDYDNDDDVKADTHGTITIRNENIEKETELVSLPFSASENATTDGVNCAVVPIYEDNGKGGANYSECSPRILSGRGAFMSGIARCIGVFDPWMKFGGEEGIVKTRYSSYQKVVDRLRIITIRAKLTALDLYNLDYTKPVYIAQFGQIFAIYSVETGENDICDCQLLKLKVDGVVAATYYLRLDGENEDSQWVAEADGINGTAYAITSNGTPYIVDYDSRLYVDLYEEDGDLHLSISAPENTGTEEINYNPVILGIQENDAVRRQVAVSQKAKSA